MEKILVLSISTSTASSVDICEQLVCQNNILPQTVCWQDFVVNIEDHGVGVQELELQGRKGGHQGADKG